MPFPSSFSSYILICFFLLFPLLSAQGKSLLPVTLYSQIFPRLMPGKHRDNRMRRKLESQREGVTEKESSLFGWSSDQIRLFSDSGMLVYETGKLPPSVYGWGLSDRADYLYFTTRIHVCMHAYHTICTHKCMQRQTIAIHTFAYCTNNNTVTYTL